MTKGMLLMRTVWPMGLMAPKSSLAVLLPITATLAALRTSRSVNMAPAETGQSRTPRYSGATPEMVVDQLRPLAMAWALVQTSGLMATMSRTSSLIASASCRVMLAALPSPELTPAERLLPAKTSRRFWPRAETSPWILLRAPLPTATMATTEATPMMMPSAVRMERSLFRRSARKAIIAVRSGRSRRAWKRAIMS